MPQMSPLPWVSLFLFTLVTLVVMLSYLYFLPVDKVSSFKGSIHAAKSDWEW